MDVVYFTKYNEINNNLELRYSLRSLQNLKDIDNIYFIGYKPLWVKKIIHIPFKDKYLKYINTGCKLKLVSSLPSLSKNLIYMMDDIYIINKVNNIEYYKWGSNKDVMKHLKDNNYQNEFVKRLESCYNLFPDGNNFDTHTPIIYNKKQLEELFKKYPSDFSGSKRTLYCLENNIEGVFLDNTPDYKVIKNDKLKDCKCYNIDNFRVQDGQQYLSSSDAIVNCKEFNDFLFKKFPNKCKYKI